MTEPDHRSWPALVRRVRDEWGDRLVSPANSSIAAFVLAIGLLKHQLDDLEVGTRESVAQAVDTIWEQLDEWDPDGLADEESRWNVLLNEYALEYD